MSVCRYLDFLYIFLCVRVNEDVRVNDDVRVCASACTCVLGKYKCLLFVFVFLRYKATL